MRQRFPYTVFFSVFLPFLILYRLTTNQIFSFDAITNAIACESNEPVRWFHANHPLYPFMGMVWYRLETLAGYAGYSIYSLARFNTFLMASALGLLAAALSGKVGKLFAILVTFCLGTTFAVWNYAVDGRAVGASVFFSVLVILALFRIDRKEVADPLDEALLGISSALLILTHAIAVFHVVPVAVWLAFRARKQRLPWIFMATVLLLVGGMYTGVYMMVVNSDSFAKWALGYAGHEGGTHYWAHTAALIMSGAWSGWVRSLFAESKLMVGAHVLSGAILISFLVIFRRARGLALALVAWGFLAGLFILVWSPGQEGFRLHVLVPWTAALALCISRNKLVSSMLMVLCGWLFYWNFTFGLYPAAFIRNNTGYQVLLTMEQQLKPGDLVLAAQSGTLPGIEVLLPYFFPKLAGGTVDGRLMAFHERSLEPLYERLASKNAQGASIYFAEDMFDVAAQEAIDKGHGLSAGDMGRFVARFEQLEFTALPNKRVIFRVIPKA